MIQIVITDANVKPYGTRWIVVHPCNGAILAYCDDEAEAKHVRDAINDIPRQLRGVDRKVL